MGPHPKHTILGPQQKSLCASFPGEGRKKGTRINFFVGILGVKKGLPNGQFSATKFSLLFRSGGINKQSAHYICFMYSMARQEITLGKLKFCACVCVCVCVCVIGGLGQY